MKCSFGMFTEMNLFKTIEWAKSVGFQNINSEHELNNIFKIFDVELIHTPFILEFFSKIETIDVQCITTNGVLFQLTHISLGTLYNDNQSIDTNAIGNIFCPMTNIITINPFGCIKYKVIQKK